MKISDGARTRIVKTKTRFRLVTSCCGELGAVNERFTVGIASAANANGLNAKTKRNNTLATVFNA